LSNILDAVGSFQIEFWQQNIGSALDAPAFFN
jgi:hypothetical protein